MIPLHLALQRGLKGLGDTKGDTSAPLARLRGLGSFSLSRFARSSHRSRAGRRFVLVRSERVASLSGGACVRARERPHDLSRHHRICV
jgi:hypothetical protein